MRLVPNRNHVIRRVLRATGRESIRILRLKKNRRRRPAPDRERTAGSNRSIVYVSGEPRNTPGHTYRVERCAKAAADLGYAVEVVAIDEVSPAWWRDRMPSPSLVVIWRASWCRELEAAVTAWREAGSRILFDVDDYMFDPTIARTEIIDGIRSQDIPTRDVVDHYTKVRETLTWADECIAPTEQIAAGMQALGKPAMLIPNGFDDDTYRVSREAVLRRRRDPEDGLVRIGYASGSRTHQRDFAVAVPAVARVLRERPECRLVLFRDAAGGRDTLDVKEFPELADVCGQIEWRPLVPLTRLPDELVRFDINLAPLEVGNIYCEAKSELKYFEAALVEVPTIASPTQPYRDAIVDGHTGCLAADVSQWLDALNRLVVDEPLRRRIGRCALHHVLHRFGPDGRRQRMENVLSRVLGTAGERAAAFGMELEHETRDVCLPRVPQAETIKSHGGGSIGQIAVVVPVYNYQHYVVEALQSVADQTLERLELVVVDDGSTDRSLDVVADWLDRHASRFVSATLLRNVGNQGLALTRNVGFACAESPFVFPLDADNILEPSCLELLLERLLASTAAAAHPTLQRFGDCSYQHVAQHWSPDRLRNSNYIDAMALVRKSAWAHVGGYTKGDFVGWEDYELWCKFVEARFWSEAVPAAVARYRVHGASMLQVQTNTAAMRPKVVAAIQAAHPWLRVGAA